MELARNVLKEAKILFPVTMYESPYTKPQVDSSFYELTIQDVFEAVALFLASQISTNNAFFMMKHPDFCYFCEEKYLIANPERSKIPHLYFSFPSDGIVRQYMESLLSNCRIYYLH